MLSANFVHIREVSISGRELYFKCIHRGTGCEEWVICRNGYLFSACGILSLENVL